jgi:hypothetical protein
MQWPLCFWPLSECRKSKGRSRAGASMSSKITPDHLGRAAVVYVRQSTMTQIIGNLESQRRQFDLAQAAAGAGLASG